MGLDRDDTVIRRRLRQKLEFLVEDAAVARRADGRGAPGVARRSTPSPSASEPRVALPPGLSSVRSAAARPPARRPRSARRAALERRAPTPDGRPRRRVDAAARSCRSEPLSEVSRAFGNEFATALVALEPARWSGPIESPYGLHLVLVRERTRGRVGPRSRTSARSSSASSWPSGRSAARALYERLLQKYTVDDRDAEAPETERGRRPRAGGARR